MLWARLVTGLGDTVFLGGWGRGLRSCSGYRGSCG